MTALLQHNITKMLKPKSYYYYCEDCNASYPSLKSVKEDHANLIVEKMNVFRPKTSAERIFVDVSKTLT